jgi:hypothetical protein
LNLENQSDKDDIKHWWNPNKYENSYAYSQQKDAHNTTKLAFAEPKNVTSALAEPKNATQSLVQNKINPAHPEGLVPPPKDAQYEVPPQLKRPLNLEN